MGRDNKKSIGDRFDGSSIKNEGWNMPNESVWRKIEKDLYADKKTRYGFTFLVMITLLLLLIALSGYLYIQNKQLQDALQNSTFVIQDDLNKTRQSKKLIVKNDEPEVSSNFALHQTSDEILESKTDKSSSALDLELTNVSVMPPSIGVDQMNSKLLQDQHPGLLLENTRERINENDLNIKPEVNRLTSIEPIVSSIKMLEMNERFVIPKKIELIEKRGLRKLKVSFLPFIASTILTRNGSQQTPLTELIDTEYGNAGFGLDIMVRKPITGSIDFTFGIGLDRMNFTTEYDLTLQYSKDEEIIDGEYGFIDFEHSLPTAFGNTETELRLNRVRNSSVVDEPSVGLDFNTNHNFYTISLPVGLMYNFGSSESHFIAGMYARSSYILIANSSIRSVYSHHSEIDAINTGSKSIYEDIDRFNLSLGFQFGYQKIFSNRSSLNFLLDYQNSLFPIFSTSNYSTTIQRVGFSVGYTYSI